MPNLTQRQKDAAAECLRKRPPVLDGTRVVLDSALRNAWYAEVRATMLRENVSSKQSSEFCDLAGVPD